MLVDITDIEKRAVWEQLANDTDKAHSTTITCAVEMTRFYVKHQELIAYAFDSELDVSELQQLLSDNQDEMINIIIANSNVMISLPRTHDD